MSLSRAETLINKLINNKLSGEELSELLEGINSAEDQQKYSDALEIYFDYLLKENQNGQAGNGFSQNGNSSNGHDST
ncbi:hypothetical protein [Dyadobacter sp. CY326]|uniref:hypothetical protein n=1 Tax=Dyadobacter sp. CY326 TaxID=2907300 RepID=UPI001F47EFF9|nr:hypothetical protein [Dyadobacter sp. CY326]MCE7066226.1 hypothetical protein [Dyadobacter sp. CY326]